MKTNMFTINYAFHAKVIAWIEMITSVVGFFFVSITTLLLGLDPKLRNDILEQDQDNFLNMILHFSMPEIVTSVVIPVIYFLCEFVLAVFLYKSVTERHYRRLRLWYIITVTICMTAIYFFLPGVFFTDDSYYFLVIFIGSYAFTGYSIWVVYCLLGEMKKEGLHFPVITYEDDAEKL